MIQKALELLKQFQAQQGAKLKTQNTKLIEKRPENTEVTIRSYNAGVEVVLKEVYESKLTEILQKFEEKQLEADIDTYREPGGKFQDYGEIDNVFDQGKTHLVHKQGEVLLVDVWATWCGPCQNPMKHNQEMLVKNEAVWGDKVRIIGVSVDEDKKVIQQRVTSKKWQKVNHLTLLGWKNDHKLVQDFKIRGIPFICLVNKWGKINFTGHPSEINLQTRINELLNQQQDNSTIPKTILGAAPATANSNKELIDKLFSLFTKENIEKDFKDVGLICFRANKKQNYQNGVSSSQLKIDAYYLDGDQVAENLVKKLFDNIPGVTLNINTVKYTPIPQVDHPECSLCQSKDLQYPFYWLKWEEGDKFGCRTCVQKKSQVQNHHYAYEKNSVLLFGKWEKIATKDLGVNLQPADVSKVKQPHFFCCNGCGQGSEGIGSARYISLGVRCDPNFKSGGKVDLCQGCMSKIIEKDQGTIDSLLHEGHQDNHPFLRVLYNTNGYNEY